MFWLPVLSRILKICDIKRAKMLAANPCNARLDHVVTCHAITCALLIVILMILNCRKVIEKFLKCHHQTQVVVISRAERDWIVVTCVIVCFTRMISSIKK